MLCVTFGLLNNKYANKDKIKETFFENLQVAREKVVVKGEELFFFYRCFYMPYEKTGRQTIEGGYI